jgi:hypothetical protein
MYHSTNTLHPKKEQRNTALALTFTLLGLVVAGYLMIYVLVLNHNDIINLHNYFK